MFMIKEYFWYNNGKIFICHCQWFLEQSTHICSMALIKILLVYSSHQVAKVLEFQLQYQSFQWIFRVEFLRVDWFDLLAVQGTLKSLLQYHSSKASILWFSPSLWSNSHLYMTTGKTIPLTVQTFVSKVMSLFFTMLSRLVIAFFPRSKCLLISWLQSTYAVILESKKRICHCSIVSPSICHEVMGLDAMISVFWMLSFKPAFSPSSFTLIKRLFSSSSFSAIKEVLSEYLRLLIFLPVILITACDFIQSGISYHVLRM